MKLLHPPHPAASLSRVFQLTLVALLAPAFALANSLDWSETSHYFETTFGDETVEAAYPFTNTGDSTITIVESSASCGCTIPTLDKKVYAPGEGGTLTAVFTIGSRQGKQHKTITVITKDESENQETYELKLEVDIPVPVTFKPRVRFWKINKEATTQDIEITFNEKHPMELIALKQKDPEEAVQFDYEIETVTKGLKYIVKLTPKTPDQKSRDVFFLVSEQDENDILKRYPIYAYVR